MWEKWGRLHERRPLKINWHLLPAGCVPLDLRPQTYFLLLLLLICSVHVCLYMFECVYVFLIALHVSHLGRVSH